MEDKYKTAREKGLLWLRWSMVLATLGYSWLALRIQPPSRHHEVTIPLAGGFRPTVIDKS